MSQSVDIDVWRPGFMFMCASMAALQVRCLLECLWAKVARVMLYMGIQLIILLEERHLRPRPLGKEAKWQRRAKPDGDPSILWKGLRPKHWQVARTQGYVFH
jgi:hypothetical protein